MYIPNKDRYQKMIYRKLGQSGLKLPVLSFGLWQNFGEHNDYEKCKEMILTAFDNGITHFDLANNYGPPPGHAETIFGKILKEELMPYRDELIISTKAGFKMLEGPYQDGGSRKYLISSLDQSLKRLGIPYVDIFYHHRFDSETSLYETMLALRDIVLSGKALYVGLSNYNSAQLREAHRILKELNVPYVITQPSYSMLNRWIEHDHLLETQYALGGGTICYSALQQGLLSNKYINDIPADSRAKNPDSLWLKEKDITETLRERLKKLDVIAKARGQSIAQLALAWAIRNPKMTSTLISTSKISQLEENLKVLDRLDFSDEELFEIENILKVT
ncbi:aldo/keto reductase [Acholeplasma hippikon]|uniref:L-glyceraldehyde 3-phosphate reductase n=1 Tax=Acholeplasma hippikon TaxID=264636 RepID=A0A449BI35_9MOLU|nr:aldo/keto reductase [Acholeplasma hippikon]VEU81997.1 L-glyceraldehyde 3-phosphate reductase [Acholeplasma hippikon]